MIHMVLITYTVALESAEFKRCHSDFKMVIFTWFSFLFLLLVAYCGTHAKLHVKSTIFIRLLGFNCAKLVQFRDLALVVDLIKLKILKATLINVRI